MAKSKSSTRWLKEHFDDEYVERAQREGYRSRAVYKLQELDEREALFQTGMTVVDLGAAPGGWSQYISERLDGNGTIIACDILPMDALPGVTFIQGDFTDSAILDKVLAAMNKQQADIVISDMAPNMGGVGVVDQACSVYLVELALALAQQVLKPNGTLLVKLFQGEGFDGYLQQLRQSFSRVYSRKPKASRPRSREVYVLGKRHKIIVGSAICA